MTKSSKLRLEALGRAQTRTQNTSEAYEMRYFLLDRRFCRERGLCSVSVKEFVESLMALRPTLAASSWRQYRAASLWGLLRYRTADSDADQEALDLLTDQGSTGLPRRSSRTSGGKAKSVPVDAQCAVLTMLEEIHGRGHASAQRLADFLVASLAVGLRPVEWAHSRLVRLQGEPTSLVVRNAKATNGRGCGAVRIILVDELSDCTLGAVERVTQFMGSDARTKGGLVRTTNRLRALLRRVRARAAAKLVGHAKQQCQKLCLYSCRHQFVADAKKSGASQCCIAALAGHASGATAGKHYARKSQGAAPLIVRPAPESVAAVRELVERRKFRRRSKDGMNPGPMPC